jgi:hypothetical protein
MKYWLIVTSPENFRMDREILKFKVQRLPNRFRKQVQKMDAGDTVDYFILTMLKKDMQGVFA